MLMTQLLVDFYKCTPVIENAAALAEAEKVAAQAVGATVVGEYEVRYVPHGLTVAVFLAESHIVITTWPEYRLALLDVLLCNPQMDVNVVVAQIKERICPDGQIVVHEIARDLAESPKGRAPCDG
jgi:S-adenosylmethionine decarboxylase